MKNYDLYIFDVDGTLADRDTGNLLPGVREWFAANRSPVALATNQGGVGLRYWMESEGFGNPDEMGLPGADEVDERLNDLCARLGISWDCINVSYAYQSKSSGEWSPVPGGITRENSPEWFPEYRKPAPGMLAQAIRENGAKSAVMIGDSKEDAQAAINAGIDFIDGNVFFGRTV